MNINHSFTIQLPTTLSQWFDSNVLIVRGLKNGLYVYTYESYERVNKEIDENIKKSGDSPILNSPDFRRFMGGGTIECKINKTGELEIPDILYEYLGDEGAISYVEKPNWIEIRKGYED